MADEATGYVTCPDCGKRYRWKQQFAGQRVKCKACGGVLVMPPVPPDAPLESATQSDESEAASPGNEYELDLPADDAHEYEVDLPQEEQPLVTPEGKCPSCGLSVKPTAVICLNCGFNLKEGTRLQTQVESEPGESDEPADEGKPPRDPDGAIAVDQADEKVTEIYAPLGLVVAGILLILLDSFLLHDATGGTSSIMYMVGRFIMMGLQIPFLFGGIFIIGMLFGTSFSSIGSAALRFLGVAAFITGFGGCVSTILAPLGCFAMLLSMSVNFAAFWGICTWMFDLEVVEVVILFVFIMIAPLFILMLIGGMLLA